MNEKNTLMRSLTATGFSMFDLQLYLDTHPADTSALALYGQYRMKYLALVAEYEKKYGPLTAVNGAAPGSWLWVNDPWPWEYEANAEVR